MNFAASQRLASPAAALIHCAAGSSSWGGGLQPHRPSCTADIDYPGKYLVLQSRFLPEEVGLLATTSLICCPGKESNGSEMIPEKAPKEDVFHGSEDLKKEAHISSFEKYKELYLKSIESPDGKPLINQIKCRLEVWVHYSISLKNITELQETPPQKAWHNFNGRCIVPEISINNIIGN